MRVFFRSRKGTASTEGRYGRISFGSQLYPGFHLSDHRHAEHDPGVYLGSCKVPGLAGGQKRAALAENAKTINETTLAGIVDALMWIALIYDFHGDVMIYVDNGSMIGKWKENHRYDRLRSEFSSVEIISISREKNTKADQIGRETAFVPVETAFLGEMISRYQKWEKVEEDLRIVKQYFPQPMVQIPQFMQDVRSKTWKVEGA